MLIRKRFMYFLFLAILVCSTIFLGINSDKAANFEFSYLKLPNGTAYSGREGERYYFVNHENQELIVGSFDQEIRKNGWKFIRRRDIDTANLKSVLLEHHALYTKGDLLLTFGWTGFNPARNSRYTVEIIPINRSLDDMLAPPLRQPS